MRNSIIKKSAGFTLMELLIVMAIIGLIASMTIVFLMSARVKARDARRKAEIVQIARFVANNCYEPQTAPSVPDGNGNDIYDFIDLFNNLKAENPNIEKAITRIPIDPKTGTETVSNYKYILSGNGQDCAIYANLENTSEEITLGGLTEPMPGGGDGVLLGTDTGVNGTKVYLQYSN